MPAKRTVLRIALAQINPTVGDLQGNVQKVIAALARARTEHADLALFPEQVIPGYPAEDLLLKKQFVQDNLCALKVVEKASKGLTAVVGFVDAGRAGEIHNAAAILHDGKHVATYHKIHLPNYGVFDEKRYFRPGSHPLVFSLRQFPLGLSICEDIWIEEGPTKDLARAGARIVLNISASPYHLQKGKEREAMLSRRARMHKVWIAYANMVGGQDEIVFDGQSVIIDPQGRIVARAKAFQEDLILMDVPLEAPAEISPKTLRLATKAVSKKRQGLRPQIHAHLAIEEEILQALIAGTRDYVGKNGFQKVILGLSGGVDSALVAAIAVEALGPQNVQALFLPSRYSSVRSLEDAKLLAKNLKIGLQTVGIDGIFQSYLNELKPFFEKLPANIAEENLQARIRGNILMAFSNKFGWLVLTTGNKSETSVGYCTLYGDMAGGFAVIKDLFKDWVYRLARHINTKTGQAIIPETVLTKEPTAELRPNQKDTDSLPPYSQLDRVLKGYVEKNLGVADLIREGFKPALVDRVIHLVDRNEYKRRQAPPGVKITPLAFGKDRRYPLTNWYQRLP